MRKSLLLIPVLASGLTAQTGYTLLFPQEQDADSLDATARSLSKMHRLDISAVTPANGATMFPLLPISATSAIAGDPDGDGVSAEFYKDASGSAWSFTGCLVKNADKKRPDVRRVYWSVRDNGNSRNPQFVVFMSNGTKRHKVRPGDFVNIGENGNADFFITQDLIMKAAGTQSGAHAKGAWCICQATDGAIYYGPPRNGHYVSNGTSRVLAKEGSIIWIPKAAITYDANGNVKDVTAGSARQISERGSNMPSRNPNAVAMVTNSRATDKDGSLVATTLSNWVTNLTGLAIDPRGGTWTSSLTGTTKHPHLLFYFDNWFYRGTVFSTTPSRGALGSVAVVNGVTMGKFFGNADGKWLGAKAQGRSPNLHGLEAVAWGLKPTPPYGLGVLSTGNQGGIDTANDASFDLDIQGHLPVRPVILTLGIEAARGKPLLGVNLSATFNGFATVYTFNLGPAVEGQGITDVRGRKLLRVPNPKVSSFKGLGLVWQALVLSRAGKHMLTNPVVTEFK